MQVENAEQTAQVETEESTPSTETSDVESASSENQEDSETSTENATEKTEEKTAAEAKGAEKRIKDLVAKHRTAEREAAYWKGVAEGKVKPQETPRQETAPKGKPTIDQFENYDEYIEALTDWKVEQRFEASKTETTKTKEQERREARIKSFNERITEAADEDPDIMEYYQDDTLPISQSMGEIIMDSEAGPQLLKYLGENRKEATRISRLSPLAAAKELGKIEDKILNPTKVETKKVSQAPEPITPVKPRGKVTDPTDDNADISDFIRARNQAQFGQRG